MAGVLYGGGITNARGSFAGNTFCKNRAGAVLKARIKGVNPNTSFQTRARRILGQLNVNWKDALSDTDRAAWAAFALANPTLNAFGQTTTLSGFQWFCKLNAKTYANNFFTQTLPPASTAVSSPLTLSIAGVSGGGGSLTVDFTTSGIAAPEVCEIWVSPPMSPGRNYVSSQLKFVVDHSADGSWDITTAYEARFGTIPTGPGLKTFVRIQVVNTQTGVASPAIQASAIWT